MRAAPISASYDLQAGGEFRNLAKKVVYIHVVGNANGEVTL